MFVYVCDIARGGMGRVELVVRRDDDFVRLYARKRLIRDLIDDEESRAMFRDEARVAGMLRHPNVLSVHDIGEDDDGLFLLMEYVEGVSLTRLVEGARKRGEMLPVQLCVRIIKQAAEGLHAAHELHDLEGNPLELVHRDVSPSNILIDVSGQVRVGDFGIAKAAGRRAKTSTGLLKGKIGYLAPEILRFDKPDRRSDIYSLGVVLYELVACRRLYPGQDISDVAKRVLHEPPPDLGAERNDVPDALVELAFEMLTKDAQHRPQTAKDVVRRLDDILLELLGYEDQLPLEDYLRSHVDWTPVTDRRRQAEEVRRKLVSGELTPLLRPPRSAKKAPARRGVWIAIGGLGLLVAGSAIGFFLSERTQTPEPAEIAEPPRVVAEPQPAEPVAEPAVETEDEASEEQTAEPRRPRVRRPRPTMQAMETAPTPMMQADMELRPWGWE